MDTRIYVMTHKKIGQIDNSLYHILHVGKNGKDDLGYQGDDTGNNISGKNRSYCELTGMYWLWKNCKCDIIGICHYRRFFCENERLLDKAYVEKIIEEYPIIIPRTTCVYDGTIKESYEFAHNIKDLEICHQVIKEKMPEYLEAYDYVMGGHMFTAGNMWITRKDIYDRYCEWLFSILFEVEKRIDISNYSDYQARVFGFLSERLFRVWLCVQSDKIKEEKVKMIEPQNFNNAIKEIKLKSKLVKLKINDFIRYWKTEKTQECLIQPYDCEDDFDGGKIPVWVAWWQGLDNAPEIVKICIESIKRNLPNEIATLRIITLDNCLKYVTFSDTVIEKFNRGEISYTLMSDILRSELLYRYGGMWIDATYWVTQKIPLCDFEDGSIHTIKYEKSMWEADVSKGRWSGNYWIVPRKNELFRFLTESFWYLAEITDDFVDYFLIDYLIDIAISIIPKLEEELKNLRNYPQSVVSLKRHINDCCTEEQYEYLKKMSPLYKLDWRSEYKEANSVGKKTIYGYLKEEIIEYEQLYNG